jgi:glutamine amidotransferase
MKKAFIVDYGSGNLRSVAKALENVAPASFSIETGNNPNALLQSSHIVLPGVGSYGDCMHGLMSVPGLKEAMEEAVLHRNIPFLGICVGMQMLLERGFEHGGHKGLGWIKGDVVRLERPAEYKIPHMGWNALSLQSHPLLEGIGQGAHAYFVHSYHAKCANPADILATTDYGGEVVAVIGHGNIMGTQFHPEKSQAAGLRLLRNFLEMER